MTGIFRTYYQITSFEISEQCDNEMYEYVYKHIMTIYDISMNPQLHIRML